jgi:hypothetical protein
MPLKALKVKRLNNSTPQQLNASTTQRLNNNKTTNLPNEKIRHHSSRGNRKPDERRYP